MTAIPCSNEDSQLKSQVLGHVLSETSSRLVGLGPQRAVMPRSLVLVFRDPLSYKKSATNVVLEGGCLNGLTTLQVLSIEC